MTETSDARGGEHLRVGFTGTQQGMTTAQLHTFRRWLFEHVDDVDEFHHGCCVGADVQAHFLVYDVFSSFMDNESLGTVLHYHPPTDTSKAFDFGDFVGTRHEPAPYLDRNRIIVANSDVLVAAPKADREELRSGTWATVRYAREAGVEVKQLARTGGWK